MSALLNVFVIAVSLSLDAFAVAVAGGVKAPRARLPDALRVGAFFGVFQGGMPLIGYLLGSAFKDVVDDYSGWVAFVLLALIGLNMIRNSLRGEEQEARDILRLRTLVALAVATSIDALVVGITLSLAGLPLLVSTLVIGVVTFVLSALGYVFGGRLGSVFGDKLELVGGLALIGIGLKLLLT